MLMWNFHVEHVDGIIGSKVEDRGSLLRLLLMLVLWSSKGSRLERWHAEEAWNLTFWGGRSWWNWLEYFWGNPSPAPPPFPGGLTPSWEWALRCCAQACKNPCLVPEVARFDEFTKRDWQFEINTAETKSILWQGSCICWKTQNIENICYPGVEVKDLDGNANPDSNFARDCNFWADGIIESIESWAAFLEGVAMIVDSQTSLHFNL